MTDQLDFSHDFPRGEEVEFRQGAAPAPTPVPPEPASPPATAPSRAKPRARRLGFLALGAVVLVGLIVWGVTMLLAPATEATDDAYVGGNVVTITARDGGTVLAIHADSTQHVDRGETLIDLDPASTDVQQAAAEAALGQAVRSVRSQSASVAETDAEIAQARADLSKAQSDLARRRGAAADGAVSGEEVSHAADAVATANATLNLAIARRAEKASAVEGTNVWSNPTVLAAIADVRRAAIGSSHMKISAPVAGVVAQRTVQIGQKIAAGTPLMAVVPLDSLWIDANFRETQLSRLRVGQPVKVVADVYGGKTVFHGHVLGLGAGSGSAFSLLPAQNASGNWIKIVQRVPVRIALDPAELRAHPLRIGMSANVTVDVTDTTKPLVATSSPPAGGVQQSLDGGSDVDARISRIIAANMGRVR